MNAGTEQKNGSGLLVYSSKTGNTKKLAEGIREGLAAALTGEEIRLATVEENPDPAGASWILLGFWADRGSADQKTLQYLKSLEGRRLGLFGTLGAYPDSAHARDISQKVKGLAAEKNTVLGCFLCQGKIDPALTERFKSLPADNPHAMTEERMKRHLEAAKHPDENDIKAAVSACLAMVKALPEGAT
ncbi:MAG: flavodoxin family protein [Treponema sp.]|jgi:flavodoxin|nr:flavodoxin family protein [Treponema sp.]